MKSGILIWSGWLILLLFGLTRWRELADGLETGILLGAALVVFVVYPALLRGLERRIARLERDRAEG
jgi:hypothetical protein